MFECRLVSIKFVVGLWFFFFGEMFCTRISGDPNFYLCYGQFQKETIECAENHTSALQEKEKEIKKGIC